MTAYSAAQLVIAAMLSGLVGGAIGAYITLQMITFAVVKIGDES